MKLVGLKLVLLLTLVLLLISCTLPTTAHTIEDLTDLLVIKRVATEIIGAVVLKDGFQPDALQRYNEWQPMIVSIETASDKTC